MSIWIFVGTEGGIEGAESRAILVDSVTEMAFGPLLADHEEADGFLAWAEEMGVGDLRHKEPRELVCLLKDYHKSAACSDCGKRRALDPAEGGRCDDCYCDHVALPKCDRCGEHTETCDGGDETHESLCDGCREAGGIAEHDAREITRGLR